MTALAVSPDQGYFFESCLRGSEENVFSDGPQTRDARGARARTLGPAAANGELFPITLTRTAVEKRCHLIKEVPIRVELAFEDFRWTGAHA